MGILKKISQWLVTNKSTTLRVWQALTLVLALDAVFGIGFYFAERGVQPDLTVVDGIWWAMVTMTTVGYGDFFPQTWIGRFLIAYPVFLIGIGLVAYMIGVVADGVLQAFSRRRRGLMTLQKKDHVIVCNCPNEDRVVQLVQELRADRSYHDADLVLVTDQIEVLPDSLHALKLGFVQGDPAREETLQRANAAACRGVFVLPVTAGDPESDYKTYAIGSMVKLIERDAGTPIKTVVEVVRRENVRMMQRANVDGVICADGLSGQLLVQEFMDPGVSVVVGQILTTLEGSQFYLHKTQLVGYQFRQVQLGIIKHPTDIQVVGVLRAGNAILNPPHDFVLEEGDEFVVLTNARWDFLQLERELLRESEGAPA
jgi:voltage-gated potassium channel